MWKKNSARRKCRRITHAVGWLLCLWAFNALAQADLREAERAVRTREYQKAFNLYKSAAQAGDPEAQYQLANIYLLGRGVAASEILALNWLEQSAAQGHAGAQYVLAMKIIDRDRNRATRLVESSAAQGYGAAQTYLARRVPETVSKGDETQLWLGAARSNRVTDLKRLYRAGTPIDRQDSAGRSALHAAIEAGGTDAAAWLLEQGADANLSDHFGISPLFLALDNGGANLLQRLFTHGGDSRQALPNGDNLLHYSLRRRQYNLVPLLIQKGVPVNHKNNEGWTPLDLAEYAAATETVAVLKAKGAVRGEGWKKPDEKQNVAKLANQIAGAGTSTSDAAKIIFSGNVKLLKQVIRKQPSVLEQKLEDGSTLLSLAVKKGSLEMVDALLQAGAPVDQPALNDVTPLRLAAREGLVNIARRLLDANADPIARDAAGSDAVDVAIRSGHQGTLELMLEWLVANQNKVDDLDNYLLVAAEYDRMAMVESLAPLVKKTVTDKQGRNALWFAAKNKNEKMISVLLENNASAIADEQGRTPFYTAIENNCLGCAKLLLPHSNINQQTNSGSSSLMAAARDNNKQAAEWLLQNKADPELRNAQGNTALIIAVEAEAIDIVRLLVDAGVNTTRKNKLGFSAVDIAEQKNEELYRILKSRSLLKIF